MLELLAGPFTVQDDTGTPMSLGSCYFVDGRGLYSPYAYYPISSGGCTFDGHFHMRGLAHSQRRGYDIPAHALLAVSNTAASRFDPETGCVTDVLHTAAFGYADQLIWTGDRWLSFSGGSGPIYALSATDPAATFVIEAAMPVTPPGYRNALAVHPTDDGRICVALSDGGLLFYDPVRKQQVGTEQFIDGTLTGLLGCWYSTKHDVFVSLHYNAILSASHTRIWASVSRPAALATPTPLSPLLKGQVITYQTRLTGSNGEPCPNEIIDWALTGNGALLSAQTTTDINGYTSTRYAAPVDSLPSITLTATARF